MQGQILQGLIQQGALNLPRNTNVADFEVLYTILLEERGTHRPEDIKESEEKFVLTILCRFPFLGKLPDFANGICALLSNYTGVSESRFLRERFRSKLSPRLIRAVDLESLSLSRIHGVLKRRHA